MAVIITRLTGKVQFADGNGNVNFAADFSDSIAPDLSNDYGVFFKRDNAIHQGTGFWIDYRDVTTPDTSLLTRSEFITLMCNSFFFKLDSGGTALAEITSDRTITKEPTGFEDPELAIVSYDKTTAKVTVTGVTRAYWRGVLRPEMIPGWQSPALTDTYPTPNQPYYLYFDGTNYVWNTLPWSFDKIQIAYVYYRADGTFIFAIREPHGLMPNTVHEELHGTIGTYKKSGGTLSNYTLNSTTATNRRPTNDATVIKDEDVPTSHPARLGANFTHAYLTGASTSMSDWNNPEIVKVSGSQPYYNRFDGTNWIQQLMSNNSYMTIWGLTFPTTADADSQRYNFFYFQGQSEGNLISQQALQPQNVNLGALANISPEFVFLNKIIIHYTGGNWKIVQVDNLLGNRFIQIGTPASNYLSQVATDGVTIEGTGTTSDPVRVLNLPKALTQNLGSWNATTNTPTIVSGVGNNGDFYKVGTAGSTNIDGISTWTLNDYIWFDGSTATWQRIAAGGQAIPGGLTGQIQINNAGAFTGDASLVFDIVNKRLYNAGFTQLGAGAPRIKTKKLTGTTSAAQGGSASILHGLTPEKIISFTAKVIYTSGAGVPASYRNSGSHEYDVYHTSTHFYILNSAANSVDVLAKPYVIYVTYEE